MDTLSIKINVLPSIGTKEMQMTILKRNHLKIYIISLLFLTDFPFLSNFLFYISQ